MVCTEMNEKSFMEKGRRVSLCLYAFCHEGIGHNIETAEDVMAHLEFPGDAADVFLASAADLPGVDRLEITLDQSRILRENGRLRL